MKTKHNKKLTPIAIKLRKRMTEQEKKLWYLFLKRYSVRILRQKVIDRFVLDFYCAKARLAIEIDGTHHFTDSGHEYDEARSELISNYGIKIIRFTNRQIDKEFNSVCIEIDKQIQIRLKDY